MQCKWRNILCKNDFIIIHTQIYSAFIWDWVIKHAFSTNNPEPEKSQPFRKHPSIQWEKHYPWGLKNTITSKSNSFTKEPEWIMQRKCNNSYKNNIMNDSFGLFFIEAPGFHVLFMSYILVWMNKVRSMSQEQAEVLIFCDSDTSERLRFDDKQHFTLSLSDCVSSQRQNAVASNPHYVNPQTQSFCISQIWDSD